MLAAMQDHTDAEAEAAVRLMGEQGRYQKDVW